MFARITTVGGTKVRLVGKLVVAVLISLVAVELRAQDSLSVSTDFEGGSAQILSIDAKSSTIRVAPGGESDRGWVCWWFLRIDHTEPGQRIALELAASDQPTRNNGQLTKTPLAASWAMPGRASISHNGQDWEHSEPGRKAGSVMRYELTAQGEQLWVAWGPPFTPRDAVNLIAQAQAKIPGAGQFELGRTRENRAVSGLKIRSVTTDGPRAGVWIQARQHAWESGSSWVARGLVEWLASQDEYARWLIEHAEIVVVPIMDVDNVITGNGGKEENPRDHNRDWDRQPVFPEVAAAQVHLQSWAKEGRLDLFVDLHNPGPSDARPFFFCGPPELLSDAGRDNRALFLAIAHKQINGPLPVESSPRITGPSYHPLWRQISGQWVNEHGNDHTMAVCLETSWNTPHSTTSGYRAVGRQLGLAIAEYIKRRRDPKQ